MIRQLVLGLALIGIQASLAVQAADIRDYPRHVDMPPRPTTPADYQNMWDLFALRVGAENSRALAVPAESTSQLRLMGRFDVLPWNGRQIARDSQGNWLVLISNHQTGAIYLAQGFGESPDPYRPRGADLMVRELIGSSQQAIIRTPGGGQRASMVVDKENRLHIVYQRADGLWHLEAKLGPIAKDRLATRADWAGPRHLVTDPCQIGDLLCAKSGQVYVSYTREDAVYVRSLSQDVPEVVASRVHGLPNLRQFTALKKPEDDAAAPGLGQLQRTIGRIPLAECICQDAVMDESPDGTIWLAFRRDFEIWVAQRNPQGSWSRPERVVREYAFNASLIVSDGQPLLVYHHDGLQRIPLDLQGNLTKRAGGGSAIGYAVRDRDGWRTGLVVAPDEVVVHRRGMWAQRGQGRLLPQIEQLGWPVLFRDPRGVTWALWQNTTRRWAYCARWLGESFGEVQECRGPFNAPRLPVNAEKHPPKNASDVGLVFHAAAAGGNDRVIFDRLKIPSLSLADSRKILFLDSLEIAQAKGVELVLNTMTKPIREPALSPQPGGSLVYPMSIVKRGELFVLGYSTGYELGSKLGWAISRDGLRFEHVEELPEGLPVAKASQSRSLDYWKGLPETTPPPYYLNPNPIDSAKKFVRLGFSIEARGSYWLEYSPDGARWVKDRSLTATEAMRERAVPKLYMKGDPERPIRIYGRVYTETGRSWGVIWSKDLQHWSGLEHLLDPDDPYGQLPAMDRIGTTGKEYTMRGQIFLDAVAGQGEDEIYAASVQYTEGLYFCFYWPGHQGRPLTDVGIAVSRDGFNFTRVKNGERILPLGPPGAWDSGVIFQMLPLLDGDRVRVYYRGTAGRREGSDSYDHHLTEIGVATIRADGFTYYRLREGMNGGSITTIPIKAPQTISKSVYVNVEGIQAQSSALVAEVLDASTGQAIAGYTASEFMPLGEDGLNVRLTWKGGQQLPTGRDIRLRFHLGGRNVRLYGFHFQ